MLYPIRKCHALVAGFSLATAMALNAQPNALPEVTFTKFELPNGLRVVLSVDKSAPVVATFVHYHVGSKNERPDRTGFAHFFEHLMFEGTDNIPRHTIDKMRRFDISQMPVLTAEPPVVMGEVIGSIDERTLIDAVFSGRAQLTSGSGPYTNPVWSPDGKWIAYLAQQGGGDWQVWAMRADGSEPRQVTFGPQQKFYLAWGR